MADWTTANIGTNNTYTNEMEIVSRLALDRVERSNPISKTENRGANARQARTPIYLLRSTRARHTYAIYLPDRVDTAVQRRSDGARFFLL